MKFQIDRALWYQGADTGSALLVGVRAQKKEDQEKMCCLGFRALAAGHTQDEIYTIEMPHQLMSAVKHADNWTAFIAKYPTHEAAGSFSNPGQRGGGGRGTPLSQAIAQINDLSTIARGVKESILEKLFRVAGDEVEFVGNYPGPIR